MRIKLMRIRKGDQVKIIAGKDRGKTGAVLRVLPSVNKVVVEGINLYKKRVAPRRQGQKGETVSVARPMSVSNVMLVCSNCRRATRVGFRQEANRKIRYCKKCQASI